MNPIPFKGQSAVLQKPSNMTDEQCESLPILRLDNTCISCWRLTWRERLKSFFTGRVWLGILSGQTQPPVYVAVDRPFELEQAAAVKAAAVAEAKFTAEMITKYGAEAAEKLTTFNKSGIPQNDFRRCFGIDAEDFKRAEALKMKFFFGLKLFKR